MHSAPLIAFSPIDGRPPSFVTGGFVTGGFVTGVSSQRVSSQLVVVGTDGRGQRISVDPHDRLACGLRSQPSPFLSASARMRLISQPFPHPWFAISVAIAFIWVTARTAALRSVIDVAETENLSLISRCLGRQIGHHSWSFPGYARDQAAKSQRNLLGSLRPLAPTRPRRCNPPTRSTDWRAGAPGTRKPK
jgi:hypothetical protein